LAVAVNGKAVEAKPHVSGDAAWLTVQVDAGPTCVVVEAKTP
jgi:hypothetical protein